MPNIIDNYLFKFFDCPKYVEEYRTGKIRLMSAYHYATLESNAGFYNNRYDITEGQTYVIHRDNPDQSDTYKWGNGRLTLNAGVIATCFNGATPNKQLKLSCFYALKRTDIHDGKFANALSTMKSSLGEYYCFFTDPTEFLRRIQVKLTELMDNGILRQYKADRVNYYDFEHFTGVSNPFYKPNGLDWQREYRLLLQTINQPDPFYIDIGDIKGITVWGEKKDLMNAYISGDDTIVIPNNQH